jgi:hypothetical protein
MNQIQKVNAAHIEFLAVSLKKYRKLIGDDHSFENEQLTFESYRRFKEVETLQKCGDTDHGR